MKRMSRKARQNRHEQIRQWAAMFPEASQHEIAQAFGLTQPMVSKILNEKPTEEASA